MKIGTILRQITAFVIAVALCVIITDTTSFAKTKAKPTLSDTSLTMWTNQDADLSLENASSKVTWISSNRKIVKIDKTFGKYNKNVSLKAGKMDVDAVFTCEMHIIPPKTSISRTSHLENYYDISKLTKGSYRLYVNVYYPNVKDTYVKFKLK